MACSSSSSVAIRSLVCAAAIAIVMLGEGASPAAAAFTCDQIMWKMESCLMYLMQGRAPPPSPLCCINARAVSTGMILIGQEQYACNCFKNAAIKYHYKPELVASLHDYCSISFPFEISPTVDCSIY